MYHQLDFPQTSGMLYLSDLTVSVLYELVKGEPDHGSTLLFKNLSTANVCKMIGIPQIIYTRSECICGHLGRMEPCFEFLLFSPCKCSFQGLKDSSKKTIKRIIVMEN